MTLPLRRWRFVSVLVILVLGAARAAAVILGKAVFEEDLFVLREHAEIGAKGHLRTYAPWQSAFIRSPHRRWRAATLAR